MKCPHCSEEVVLTWKRYLASPMGRHTCPACGERFRLKPAFKYYVFVALLSMVLGLAFLLLQRLWGAPVLKLFPLYAVLCLIFTMAVDRWYDANHREVAKISPKEKVE